MQIEQFEQELGKAPKRQILENTKIVIERPKPKPPRIQKSIFGWREFLANLFEKNEYLPRANKLSDGVLRDTLLKGMYHYRNLKKFFYQRRLTVGSLRRKYNRFEFGAIPRYLISQTYDELGYPIVGGHNCYRYKHYLYFEEAYARCVAWKVADPRFIEYEYIVALRNRQLQNDPAWLDWLVPDDKELKTIATKLKVKNIQHIYSSVVFARYHHREDTPKDFVPFARLYDNGYVSCPPERL